MPQTDNNINFDDLFRYNYRPLCLYALHYLQDADLAEDVVQESYTALWEKLQEGVHVLNRKSYLYMMVRNRCLDNLRKKGIPTESLKPYDTYGIIDDDDAQERSQTEARMWTARDSLPEKCRPRSSIVTVSSSKTWSCMRLWKLRKTGEDWTDFEYILRISSDFYTPLLSRGPNIKVLQPQWLAEEIRQQHLKAAGLYEGAEGISE